MIIYVISKYIGDEEVGIYDLINRIVSLLITPFHVIQLILLPKFTVGIKKSTFMILLLLILLTSSALIFLFLIFDILILGFIGVDILYRTFYSLMLISVILLAISSSLGTLGLSATGNYKNLFISSLFSNFLLFILILVSLLIYFDLTVLAIFLNVAFIFESVFRFNKVLKIYGN